MAKNDKIGLASSDHNIKYEKTFRDKYCEFIQKHRSIGIILLLLLLYVSCISFWEDIIAKTLVEKFFSQVKPNFFSQVIFLLFFGYLIIRTFLTKHKLHSPSQYLIYVISLGLLVYYRLISNKFEWTSLATIHTIDIKYIDVVAAYAICVFFRSIIDVSILKLKKEFVSKDGFIRDTPIKNENEDIFGRNDLACAEIDRLLGADTTEDAFSYGIVSPWGMGKTSFMNLMKGHINTGHKKECFVINFNPWLYSNDTNIVELFFDELSNYLKPYNSRLANSFIAYSKALSAVGTTETKIVSTIIDLIGEHLTIKDKADVIKKSIKKINKKIVIFVDDIDRLESNEIMDVLKLIRNVSNFPNMYFVVAYDKEYLLECLKNKMPSKELEFTEKFFDREFHLPLCVKKTLKDNIENYISSDMSDDEKNKLYKVIYERNIFNDSDIDAISTIRDVKRICNSFNVSYSRLKGEVNICDLFMLEILKNKYPTVYAILENHRNLVLQNKNNRYELFVESGENALIEVFSPIDLKKHIKENYKSLHIKEIDIKRIENLLDAIFPQTIMAKEKSINNIHYFDRYFNLALLESDLSDVEFDKLLQSDIEEIKSKIKDWAVNKTSAMLSKFDMLQPQSRDEQKKHIQMFLYSISILPNSILDTEHTHMCNIITNKIKELGELSTDDKEFIKNALCENGYSTGLGNYLSSVSFEANQWDYPLSREELNVIRCIVFKDCISKYTKDMKTVIQGFENTNDYSYEKGRRVCLFIKDNIDLMKEYAISHFSDFIKYSIKQNVYSDKEYQYNIQNLPWESLDDYISFIKSIEPKTPVIDEYLEFVEKYKEKNPTEGPMEPMGFEFKYIKFGES